MTQFTLVAVLLFAFISPCVAMGEGKEATSQILTSFPELTSLKLEEVGITIYYNPKSSEVLSDKPSQPTESNEEEPPVFHPLRSQLLGEKKGSFLIACDNGASDDPGCAILKEEGGNQKEVSKKIWGLIFIFPGDGSIYAEGHMNTMFNERKKYAWKNNAFSEVKQPYKYVGLDSTTKTAVTLVSSPSDKEVVATLPKGSPVTVLLNEGDHYLIKTPFGVLGWLTIQEGSMEENSPIKGIYYAGD